MHFSDTLTREHPHSNTHTAWITKRINHIITGKSLSIFYLQYIITLPSTLPQRLQLLKSTTGVTMMTPSQDVCCSIRNILQTSSQCQCSNLKVSHCQFSAVSYLLIFIMSEKCSVYMSPFRHCWCWHWKWISNNLKTVTPHWRPLLALDPAGGDEERCTDGGEGSQVRGYR